MKKLINTWKARTERDKEWSENGKFFLKEHSEYKNLITYKRKKWDARVLLLYLANKVEELEKNQCKPSVSCIFDAEDALYNETVENNNV